MKHRSVFFLLLFMAAILVAGIYVGFMIPVNLEVNVLQKKHYEGVPLSRGDISVKRRSLFGREIEMTDAYGLDYKNGKAVVYYQNLSKEIVEKAGTRPLDDED